MTGGRYARDLKRTALADPQTYQTVLYRPEMYRTVVVPLDESEQAQGVLPHVAEVIRGRGSRVYLLSVVPPLKGGAPAATDARPLTFIHVLSALAHPSELCVLGEKELRRWEFALPTSKNL